MLDDPADLSADLSALGESLRRHDHDRFVTAMFAPPERRADLWVLYAFNLELSQIRSQVREPLAGMIRLQWWRDVVEGTRREEALRHPVGGKLLRLIESRQLPLTYFHRLLEGRERDFDAIPFASIADWQAYGQDTAGALTQLAALVLGHEAAAAQPVGTVWALTGLLRSLPFHLAQGWMTLPVEALNAAGLEADAVAAAKADKAAVAMVVMNLLPQVQGQLAEARRHAVPRVVIPAVLPAVQAGVYLRRMRALSGDVFDSRSYRPQPMPLRLALAAVMGSF